MRVKIATTLFAAITMTLISFPVAYRLACESPIPINAPKESFFEGRNLTTLENLMNTSPFNPTFQDVAEQFASDSIPVRDDSVLFLASLQQATISLAATPFDYAYRPTFFGSEYIVDTSMNRIIQMPKRIPQSQNDESQREAFCSRINSAAQTHPETRFVVAQICAIHQTETNPLNKYITAGQKGVRTDFRTI